MTSFHPDDRTAMARASIDAVARQTRLLQRIPSLHSARFIADQSSRWTQLAEQARALGAQFVSAASSGAGAPDASAQDSLPAQWAAFVRDTGERTVLMLDLLRERAVQDDQHAAAGTPPVLIYDHELVIDGADLDRPTNYRLLRILPPEGVVINPAARPFIIIDPRAGHGAGIGGFKTDSQVGVALKAGHPVYFVAFGPHPHKGQTLADVMRAEAAFVREVRRLHASSEAPAVIGNCQGGWASLLLAAANPDLTGPVVLNGAPVATWSGRVGENPMRYNGGVMGGIVPALFAADLNNGELDGASLVGNFEMLDPSRNFIGKYYDVFKDIDSDAARTRFLEFERWWGGYHFLAEEEIRWIVEQLFIGNRLSRNEARLERGRELDIKGIRSPIIVFASFGDNITPPQQALNWVLDTYSDELEIKVRGQRIIYTLHEKVGHLGIFVSSKVARHEHREITSALRIIETLPPGLYEMRIESVSGEGDDACFEVCFAERGFDDLRAIDDGDEDEQRAFAAVSRYSELWSELYELTARPVVQATSNSHSAQLIQALQPGRLSRSIFGEHNPLMAAVPLLAEQVRAGRRPVEPANLFAKAQGLWMEGLMQAVDAWRDMRDMWTEQTFYALWSTPFMAWAGERYSFQRTHDDASVLRHRPEVELALARAREGGYPAGLVRMMLLVADARGSIRSDRLDRADLMLETAEQFRSFEADGLARLINEQALIVEFEPALAIETLPHLLPTQEDRRTALDALLHIAGKFESLQPSVAATVRTMLRRLDLPEPVQEGQAAPVAQAPDDAQLAPPSAMVLAAVVDQDTYPPRPAACAQADVHDKSAPPGTPPANAAA